MSWVLLSNDDGVDSPALLPFAAALERVLDVPVRVCVPDAERSWSGKAVTRTRNLSLRTERRDGRLVSTVDGTPADAVQLGLYAAFAADHGGAPPLAVVTGINIGHNHGSAFLASSGTVWGAAEAAYAGLPAIAVSTGGDGDFAAWRRAALDPAAGADWDRIARVGAHTVRAVADAELQQHGDLWAVSVPWGADLDTPRRVTSLAPLSYGPLFDPTEVEGEFRPRPALATTVDHTDPANDVAVVARGEVSVTPVVLPRGAVVPDHVRRAFER